MADNSIVFTNITKRNGVSYPVLVPNLKGLEAAVRILNCKNDLNFWLIPF